MPASEAASAPAATVLGLLAERAATVPEEPWLFFRQGWDWRWRSYLQVADQVARGAERLGTEGPRRHAERETRIACDGGQDPDAVAAGLAIEAAGYLALPIVGEAAPEARCDAVVTVGASPPASEDTTTAGRLLLPGCRSPLERWEPQPLRLDAVRATMAQGQAYRSAERLAAKLPANLSPSRRRRGRPILCAGTTPDFGARDVWLAWTLVADAAWVLLGEDDDFVMSVLWARPTVVAAEARRLERLAAALAQRRHRRRHRLRAVVVVGEEPPAARPWDDLGVTLVAGISVPA